MKDAKYSPIPDPTIDYPHHPVERDFPKAEYELRVSRGRALMAVANLDALVITSSSVGQWFTGQTEPHSWHDRVPSRSTWYILTHQGDYLFMPPTNNHQFSTARKTTWVTHIGGLVERSEWPRTELWGLEQVPRMLADVGLAHGQLGFELGDNMTLGISVSDFLRLRELMPGAQLVDGAPVIRRLMSIQTPLEIDRVRVACRAGNWIHNRVVHVLRPGMTERDFFKRLSEAFRQEFGEGYSYRAAGGWDIRNPEGGDYNLYHATVTNRVFRRGDQVCRGTSGVSFRGYLGDIDRIWYIGVPPVPEIIRTWYRVTWECNRAMAEQIKPGNRCSDVYDASIRIEERHGFPQAFPGRRGHGIHNTGGLSVHPDNHTVLEPGMILSVEPMLANAHGFYDLEDQYVVTETGHECLHDPAPEEMPLIGD